DDTLAATVSVEDTALMQVNRSVAKVKLPVSLNAGTSYYVTIDKGAFVDRAGNEIAAISDNTEWSFTTVSASTKPAAAIDYAAEQLTGLDPNGEYDIDGMMV